MEHEPTKDEVDRRAKDLANRVMSTPYEPQKWPGKRAVTEPTSHDGATTPRPFDPSAGAS